MSEAKSELKQVSRMLDDMNPDVSMSELGKVVKELWEKDQAEIDKVRCDQGDAVAELFRQKIYDELDVTTTTEKEVERIRIEKGEKVAQQFLDEMNRIDKNFIQKGKCYI